MRGSQDFAHGSLRDTTTNVASQLLERNLVATSQLLKIMDTHIKGPRGGRSQGAIVSQVCAGAKFGDNALSLVEFFKTDGASSGLGIVPNVPGTNKKFPILIEIFGHILTAFDGTGPVLRLTETNLDDTGAVVIANISDFTAGKFSLAKFITTDKKYKITYTIGTAGPTAGEGFFSVKATGPGIPHYPTS